ncbi:MAG: ExeA family protein [Nitrospiraceae bacterium]
MKSAELAHWARAWGAREIPFTQPHWMETPRIQKLLQQLDHAASFAGVHLLTGANGVGTSALVAHWLWKLDTRFFLPVAITQASLSGCGLLATLVTKLGKTPGFRREINLQGIESALAELGQRRLVLVLDEAQLYSQSALEEIRLLLGLNLPERPTFALILIGDPYLADTLRLRHHRALHSRIASHGTVEPWSFEESKAYLASALALVGLDPAVLQAPAAEQLIKSSAGHARSLELLSRAAWLQAAEAGAKAIQPEHVQKALESVPCVPALEAGPRHPTSTHNP